ncbi:MAG: glycoside-pentoside-hexuronide (GPH):cation symporter [Lachnospiraceae bacterium]|nr:glycoside-pentoside-hexuronide (GPH):cation symporter [Lachnospiraceae bacterium]
MKLTLKEKASYGLGAVGKDMVYALSATYILYYYQDLLHVPAIYMGIILLCARVFDAFNDPVMGIIVARTRTRWGKFRPWLMIGTLLNSVFLILMFAVPASVTAGGLVAWAAVMYILWGVTYTMMDIPYWSMVPAFTEAGPERENVSALGRSCAGVGSALIQIFTMMVVPALGAIGLSASGVTQEMIERNGFKYLSIGVAVLFILFITITCVNIREKSTVEMETASVGAMFRALIENDQAMTVVIAIVLVNSAFYITSNLIIYFFKYDFGGSNWYGSYTLFNMFGGGMQILSMMILFPLLRRFMDTIRMFRLALCASICGYLILLAIATFTGMGNVFILFIPAFFVFSANGILTVLTTVFLANSVDYGQLKNGRRDESVIFSMQTFVVKLASGIAAMLATVCLTVFQISSDNVEESTATISAGSAAGLRMTMTILPMIGLAAALLIFIRRYILTEDKITEISRELKRREND